MINMICSMWVVNIVDTFIARCNQGCHSSDHRIYHIIMPKVVFPCHRQQTTWAPTHAYLSTLSHWPRYLHRNRQVKRTLRIFYKYNSHQYKNTTVYKFVWILKYCYRLTIHSAPKGLPVTLNSISPLNVPYHS